MLQKVHIPTVLLYAVLSAVAYGIPMTYFIASAQYEKTWWLFVGNFLFMLVIIIYMLVFTKRKHEHPNTSLLLTAGHVVTTAGVILSCLFAFIVLSIYAPGILGSGTESHVLENSPAHTDDGKTDGLVSFVFLDAVLGNFSSGSAVAIFLAYTTKRDQTKEDVITHVKVDTSN